MGSNHFPYVICHLVFVILEEQNHFEGVKVVLGLK
jgi:hypothetical protein